MKESSKILIKIFDKWLESHSITEEEEKIFFSIEIDKTLNGIQAAGTGLELIIFTLNSAYQSWEHFGFFRRLCSDLIYLIMDLLKIPSSFLMHSLKVIL